MYHPAVKAGIYEEYKPAQQASNEVDWIEFELQALNLAKSLTVDEAEAILRVEMGASVTELSSSEIKRDVIVGGVLRQSHIYVEIPMNSNQN